MKLRWRKDVDKVWKSFTHVGGALDGVTDGGYAYVENGERTLQFWDTSTETWVDVPESY